MKTFWGRQGEPHKKPKGAKVDWRISVYALITSNKNEILMVMPTWNNQWELPGGGLEVKESITECVLRESYEETGYKIKLISDIPLYIGEEDFFLEKNHYFHSLILIYPARLASKKQNEAVINSIEKNEINKVKWIKFSELNKGNCQRIFWPAIKKYKISGLRPRSI